MADDTPDDPQDDLLGLPSGTRLRVVLLAIASVSLALTLAWMLSGGGEELFNKKFSLHAFLSDGTGLDRGANVMLNGVPIGKVSKVSLTPTLDPTRVVRVDLKIQHQYMNKIPIDSIAALTADNLLGDKYVNVAAGKSDEHVADGAEIASLIQNGAFNPADLVASLQETLARVNAILTEIQQGDTPLAQFVRGTDFYTGLQKQVTVIQNALHQAVDSHSTMGQLLFTDNLYNQIRQPILNIDRSLEETQRGENRVGHFLNDSSDYDKAVKQVHDLDQSLANANAGKGGAGPWLKTDAKYEEIEGRIRSIDAAVDKLTTGNGVFARLLESRQMYDTYAGKAAKARDFTKDFREDPQKYMRIKVFGKDKKAKPAPHP
jgi:phospholipid/cholesterol/gamma-HCH transport system substrate-binding protein